MILYQQVKHSYSKMNIILSRYCFLYNFDINTIKYTVYLTFYRQFDVKKWLLGVVLRYLIFIQSFLFKVINYVFLQFLIAAQTLKGRSQSSLSSNMGNFILEQPTNHSLNSKIPHKRLNSTSKLPRLSGDFVYLRSYRRHFRFLCPQRRYLRDRAVPTPKGRQFPE